MLRINNKIESNQRVKVAEFRKEIRKTSPHKHNKYVEFIYLVQGSGTHTIDGKTYPVNPPVFYTVRKEQVHHWELEDEPEGFVLILGRSFIDSGTDRVLKELLTKVSMCNCLYVKDSEPIATIFKLLLDGTAKDFGHHADFIEGLLRSLLAKLLLQPKFHSGVAKQQSDIFLRFEELLGDSGNLRNKVDFYAGLLDTTPQNLNAVCRKAAGQTASAVLASYLVGEAKRLLLYTGMYSSQISSQLHFKDSSHFIKFFKRHTGSTPHEFRNRNRMVP